VIFLILSILTTSSLFIIFKLFDRYQINTFQAIVFNYITASLIGFLFSGNSPAIIASQSWSYLAILLGLLFITIFNLLGLTARKLGVSVSSVANKMSLVIPVMVAVIFYSEALNLNKIIGIITALLAVYLTSRKTEKSIIKDKFLYFLPILLFVGSGILDALIKHAQRNYLSTGSLEFFIACVFLFAAIAGSIGLIILLIRKKVVFQTKNIIAGVVLGIPNYFSIFYFIKSLQLIPATVVFPLNNIGIVAVCALSGAVFFKEKFSKANIIGIALSILSILIITLA
jgi:drug/metabolite transporter (DMT)-like permease